MGADPVSMGVKVALMAAQMALTMTQKIEGPRLDSLDVTTADYGTPLTYFWGKRRLEGCPIIWAEKLREKKTTSKTKGGKYAEYRYFGTFAVAIADHQIDAVSRIWMDKHLCYDMTSAGPISILGGLLLGPTGAAVKIVNGKNMRIYLGDQTSPDPRMEAWCEDRYGPDSCPAYKDVSYIVFEDLPLEKFGNRIPQITVEAVNNSNTNYLYDEATIDGGAGALLFSPDYSRFWADSGLWDTATRTLIVPTPIQPEALGPSGIMWELTDEIGSAGGPYLTRYSNDGQNHAVALVCPAVCNSVWTFLDGSVFLGSSLGTTVQYTNGALVILIDVDFQATTFEQDSEGNTYAAGRYSSVSPGVHIQCVGGTRMGDDCVLVTSSTDFPRMFINSRDEFIIEQEGEWYRLDNAFGLLQQETITASGTITHVPGSDRIWRTAGTTVTEIDISNLTVVRTLSQSLWAGSTGNMLGGIYDPVNHAILSAPDNKLVWRFLDRVGSAGTTLADVVSDVAGWCNVESVDVADLDQIVPGYSVTQGAGKDMISPLLDIHDVDARPHDFSVQFITRGDAPVGTINVSEFVREGDEPRYTISIAQDTDLPKQIRLSFADNDKDQQTNTVLFQRPNVSSDSARNQQIDLTTYVSVPGDAQKFVDRYGRRKWNGRETITNALTSQYLKIEPGDVWTLALDDVSQAARLTKVTISQGRLNTEWERDFASLHLLGTGTGAAMEGRDDDTIYISSQTKGFVLDIPLVQDSHELGVPQLYYAAGSYGGDWPGAVVFQNDAEEYFPWNTVESADKAVWGYATDALADADPWVWDRGNTVNILAQGALTSSTEAAILASPLTNLAYLGGELINFVTATLESDGTYTLSGLLRGRRGTEWACDDHAAGDGFVLVSSLERDGMGLSDVGLDFNFKAQTLGRDVEAAEVIEVDFTGASLKPYAPANLTAERDASSGAWNISGIRRTRVGGSWVGGTPIPLSEASEAYEIVIMDGTTEVRSLDVTIDGDGRFSGSWTQANQTTDFGSPQFTISAAAYQLSDAVGRGYPSLIGSTAEEVLSDTIISAGATAIASYASVTPVNPDHVAGDTLLCVVITRGTTITASCATSGWTAADGITNPTTLNDSALHLFQNECDSDAEADPVITVSGGAAGQTVIAVVLRIPNRDTAANFGLGTVSVNGSNNSTIAFAQNSPSIDNGNAIIAIGVKNNNYIVGGGPGVITGITAGLDWTELVDCSTSVGADTTFTLDYAINDSGSPYLAGTAGVKTISYSGAIPSAGVYLEVPLA